MFLVNATLLFFSIIFLFKILNFLSKTSLIHSLTKLWRFLEEKCSLYQFYKVPEFNNNMQENQLYRKIYTYLNSLPCVGDSDFANLFSSSKSTEINLILDENQTIVDKFLGGRVYWHFEKRNKNDVRSSLVLKIKKNDKRRILVPYLRYIHRVFDEIEQKRKQLRLFVNVGSELQRNGRWRWTPFTHPATMETIAMDADLKARIKSDLESFLTSGQHYRRLGRVWKRSYLLYGQAGTGKSTFVAAMAKFLRYDIYTIDLRKVASDSDLEYLLLQTTNRSLLVIEDLDRYLCEESTAVSSSGILNFMDGIFSCCGEERVMVFTVRSKENIDPNFLRPGRVDVHVNFPLCDFTTFKTLANSHLGLKDHKLFPQVEEIFRIKSSLSQAEICEIMISNRGSSTRALKTVLMALRRDLAGRVGRKSSGSLVEEQDESKLFVKEGHHGIHPIKEIKNFYGLLRAGSCRKTSIDKMDIDRNNRGNICFTRDN